VSTAARATAAAVGLGIVAATVAAVGGGSSETTYGGVSTWFAALEVGVALTLLAAALLLLAEGPTAWTGALVVLAAVVWLAPLWVGWQSGPSLVRSTALVIAPLLPAVVLAVVASLPPALAGRRRVVATASVGLVVTAVLALSVALVVVRDPLRDLYCWSDCTVQPVFGHDDTGLTHRLTSALLWLNAGVGVAVAVLATGRMAGGRRASMRVLGPALAAAVVCGVALAAYASALLSEPRELPDRPLYAWLFGARAVGMLALAAGLAWIAIRPRLVRSHVTRLAVDLERSAAEGGLGRLLAGALGDGTLRMLYPLAGGQRVVDSEGRTVETAEGGAKVTPLVGDEGVLALVESNATTVEALERELGPAAQLALGNERLRAEALAHLEDVTSSRARIVETADVARRRMERDLHDGAQQRILALTYDLRVALEIAQSSADTRSAELIAAALDSVVAASEELRDVAHGIFPVELTASGLEAALQSLADVRPLSLAVDLPPDRRYPPEIETAAYAVVADALGANGGTVAAAVREEDGRLLLVVEGAPSSPDRLLHLEDRVGAVGGRLLGKDGALEVELPAG
jgi:signal transduction histidine kinase